MLKFEEKGAIVFYSKSELGLIPIKENYDSALKGFSEFIESGKTYKEMTVEEFKQEVRLFWERSEIWKQVLEKGIFSKEKLVEDIKLFKMQVKRLLI